MKKDPNFWFAHRGKIISANSFSTIKKLAKDTGQLSTIINRNTGYFDCGKGVTQRPQQHYNYKPRF